MGSKSIREALVRRGLLFESPVEEVAYQRFRLDRTYRWLPITIVVALVTWLAFVVLDPLVLNSGRSPMAFRLLASLVFFAILGVSLLPSARPHWRWTLATLMLVGTVVTLRLTHLLEPVTPFGLSTGTGAMNMVIVLCLGLGLAPSPAGLGFALGLGTIGLYAVAVARYTDLEAVRLVVHTFNLLIVLTTLSLMSLWRERSLRQDFVDLRRLTRERGVLDKLVSDVLPRELIARVDAGERIAESFGEVTILFADLVGFTRLTTRLAPRHLVEILDRLFTAFDEAVERHGLEKVKTIGDAYMVIGGSRDEGTDASIAVTRLAFEMLGECRRLTDALGHDLELRIGIHTGSVIGGVIGRKKKVYDYWGETVNLASRLESTGKPGRIRVSEAAFWRIKTEFELEEADSLERADGSHMATYLVLEPAVGSDFRKEPA